ncbi:GlcG/HbpS family heme-binding protein [Mycolicibacterium palauense]|uniref:GlcG/HbpS family heme-binding protein n=1 Tax=Mycolicibacterium palauense TaxID=2034511 RepID=UPI000BFF1768|nr:heme-binding protein [Mycolicibacterium palauense]
MSIDVNTAAQATELSARERELFAVVADALIPDYGTRPSASGAQVPTRWIDAALAARPDLLAPLREVLAACADVTPSTPASTVFARLQDLDPALVGAVGTLTAGAYFLNPAIRELIGYPGQESRTYSVGTDLPYLNMLERVVERGEIYQPTVESDPAKTRHHNEGESMPSPDLTVITKRTISLSLARSLVDAAIAEAGRVGGAFSVVVVDESGNVKASACMDGAALSSLQVAADKAYTVVATGFTPAQWFEYSSADPKMASGMAGMDRVVTFPGGLPVVVSGEVVGAIGVSGGHYEQDLQVATAAVEAVGATDA